MLTRRQALQITAAALALPAPLRAQPKPILRPIPSCGELLPVIGMGTARTFNTDDTPQALSNLRAIMQSFLDGGGKLIDSSPMYRRSEQRIGEVLRSMQAQSQVFAATKVWTEGKDAGIEQMQRSAQLMAVDKLDLIAVHNLKDWRTQINTLRDWKEQGRVRYIGITTSDGRYRDEFLKVMRSQPIDFVQFSYNILTRSAETDILPLAQERGIATIINRPYQHGTVFSRTKNQPLPAMAVELGCDSWGQLLLKWIAAHPGVTTIIPATSKPKHMRDNMGANFGALPCARQRQQLVEIFQSLQ